MNRRDFLKYSAVGICGFSLPISMTPEKKNAFIEFAEKNFKLNYWKKGIIPFEPTKHHIELADLYDNNRFVLVKKYRQGGFTTMTLLWALHECITKPDVRIVFLARTDREAVDAKYRIIDVALNSMENKPEIVRSNAHRLQFAHGSQMHFMTCTSCCGVATDCIIFDEAAFIPDLEQWWRAMYPTISMGGKAFMVSTPSYTNGYFYELTWKIIPKVIYIFMTAQTVTGVGPGSAEGPLRGFDLDNIRKVYINESGDLLPCIIVLETVGEETKYVLKAVSDGQIKIDGTDEVPGYASEKLVAGTNISFVISAGPNKTLTINATGGGGTDEQVKIDAADSTAGYLDTKLLAGSNITLTVSAGPNKDMTISASGNPVVVDIGAADPDFDEAVLSITAVIKGTVGANFTMTDLTITDGVTDKMLFRVELTQTGGGGDISSWSSNFVGSDLIPLTSVGLSIGAGKTDILELEWDADRAQWMLVGFINGIAP